MFVNNQMAPYVIKLNVCVFSHNADSVIKIPPWAWMGTGKGKHTMHVSQTGDKAWPMNGDERCAEWHRDSVACHHVTTF